MLGMILLRILSMNNSPKSIHETQEKNRLCFVGKMKRRRRRSKEGGAQLLFTPSLMQEKTHTCPSNHLRKLIVYYNY
jgi:hypothetical protein